MPEVAAAEHMKADQEQSEQVEQVAAVLVAAQQLQWLVRQILVAVAVAALVVRELLLQVALVSLSFDMPSNKGLLND
jgi:hypothetical protein